MRKLRAGQVVSCFKLNLSCARAVEIAGLSGFDCIWTDMEHTANDWSVIEKQIWVSKAYGMDSLVRVARGGYSDYIRPLEMDATGIMVPHIMSLQDAKDVVKMTRFHPTGLRPSDAGNADGAFCQIEYSDYMKQANENRFVMIQIEDPEPLDDLDEIAALDGIDMLFFGPGDFSQAIGAPGEWTHPKLQDARKRVAEAAIRHGKFAATVSSVAGIDDLLALGYRFINVGADVVGLTQYCGDLATDFIKRVDAFSSREEQPTYKS